MSKLIRYEEVAEHATPDNLWLVVHDRVYNVSDYRLDHPGGPVILQSRGGKIATKGFELANHSQPVLETMKKFEIGQIDPKSVPLQDQIEKDNEIWMPLSVLMMVLTLAGLGYYFWFY